MAVVNDAELIELYNGSHSELFPALRRESALSPLVVLMAVLPPLFALVNEGVDSADARWGLSSLELLSVPNVEAALSRAASLDAAAAWQQPFVAALTALSLQIPGLSLRVAVGLVPFVSTIGVILVWHSLCCRLAGSRFGFWSTALIACHGPFLVHVQSPAPALLILLLALGACWGFVSHLRNAEGIVSGRLVIGGVSLGLCLLVSGLIAITVAAIGMLQAVALWIDAGQTANNGNGEARAPLRGRWVALKSLVVLVMTAAVVGGWWVMMIAAQHGPNFWVTWLEFDRIAAAGDFGSEHAGGVTLAVTAFFRLIDLLGVLFVPALFGVLCVANGLLRQHDKSRRFPLQFLAAWLIWGLTIWSVRLRGPSAYGDVWDLFVMLPLVGCAALTVEQIAVRRLRPVFALWLVCLAIVLPRWADVVRATSASEIFHGAWGSTVSLVSYFAAFAVLTVWLLLNARRHDIRQQLCLVGLLILLVVANAVHGLRSVRLTDEGRRLTHSLTEFHDSLLELESIDAQILITDAAAPPDVEFVIRSARPNLLLETLPNWNNGVARAAELMSRTKGTVLIVDWRSVDGPTTKPPEHNLNLDPHFAPTMLHGRRLVAYRLTR